MSGGVFIPVLPTYYLRLKEMSPQLRRRRGALPDCAQREQFNQNLGRLLTPEIAFEDSVTLHLHRPQMAGDLTRWMGLPWQCDAFSRQQVLCRELPNGRLVVTLLPIDVSTEAYYEAALDEDLPEEYVQAASRVSWSRGVAGRVSCQRKLLGCITNMITVWERMGFVRMPPRRAMSSRRCNTQQPGNPVRLAPSQGMLPN